MPTTKGRRRTYRSAHSKCVSGSDRGPGSRVKPAQARGRDARDCRDVGKTKRCRARWARSGSPHVPCPGCNGSTRTGATRPSAEGQRSDGVGCASASLPSRRPRPPIAGIVPRARVPASGTRLATFSIVGTAETVDSGSWETASARNSTCGEYRCDGRSRPKPMGGSGADTVASGVETLLEDQGLVGRHLGTKARDTADPRLPERQPVKHGPGRSRPTSRRPTLRGAAGVGLGGDGRRGLVHTFLPTGYRYQA